MFNPVSPSFSFKSFDSWSWNMHPLQNVNSEPNCIFYLFCFNYNFYLFKVMNIAPSLPWCFFLSFFQNNWLPIFTSWVWCLNWVSSFSFKSHSIYPPYFGILLFANILTYAVIHVWTCLSEDDLRLFTSTLVLPDIWSLIMVMIFSIAPSWEYVIVLHGYLLGLTMQCTFCCHTLLIATESFFLS